MLSSFRARGVGALIRTTQTVSHDAFAFCLAHQRKTEFRRLSETLRSHLTSSQKYSHQSHSINLNDSEDRKSVV